MAQVSDVSKMYWFVSYCQFTQALTYDISILLIREIELPSAPSIQPKNNLTEEAMNETLIEINSFFADTANFDKFIEYACLEEKKGEFLRGSTIVFWKVETQFLTLF